MAPNQGNAKDDKGGEIALVFLLGAGLCGWLVVLIFSLQGTDKLRLIGVGSMVAGASALVGAFLGLLFGVPKTLQAERAESGKGPSSADDRDRSNVRPNTNLEQISDWLTKILVGAGLTQLNQICNWVRDLGQGLAKGFLSENGDPSPLAAGSFGLTAAGAFASSTVVYFVVDGFFIAFLWARLYLGTLMNRADAQSLYALAERTQANVNELSTQIQEVKEQSELDAKAFALVIKQLNPSIGPAPDFKDLNDAIRNASQPTKARIFYQAEEVRRNNWKEQANKPTMERTIPIFRALVACDPDNQFHANHAQLGFALKELEQPNFKEAISELTKAIEIRGLGRDHDFEIYEFNRANAMILDDQDFKDGRPSAPDVRRQIIQDLEIASGRGYVAKMIGRDESIGRWRALNPE